MPPAEPRVPHGPTRVLPSALAAAAALLLVARLAGVWWTASHAPRGGQERVHWVPIAAAEAKARAEHKALLYDFSAEWCGPCRLMSRELFADPRAAALIEQRFVPVRVLDRQREEGRNPAPVDSLQRLYQVEAFPTLVVAWPGDGRHEVTRGYSNRDITLNWLMRSEQELRMRAGGPLLPGMGGAPR